jgi:hypothetical protein
MREAIRRLLGHGISLRQLFLLFCSGYVVGFGCILVPGSLFMGAFGADARALLMAPLIPILLAAQGVFFGVVVVAGLWLLGKIAGASTTPPH